MLKLGVKGIGLRKESAAESVGFFSNTEKNKKTFAV